MEIENKKRKKTKRRKQNIEIEVVPNSSSSKSRSPEFVIEVVPRKKTHKASRLKPRKKNFETNPNCDQ